MIISITPIADTYVNNLQTVDNDASYANVGKAATLDLFKLYNENKNAYSWAGFSFREVIQNESVIVLTDADLNTVEFKFYTNSNVFDGSLDNDGRVIVGISDILDQDAVNPSYASRLKDVIDNVNENNNGLTLNILTHINSSNDIILKQQKPGDSGDTSFVIPNEIVSITGLNLFARIEYSAILIKFDIDKIKRDWIVLDQENPPNILGSFANMKVELVLKDITSGLNKPYDYEIEILSLLKDFKEGIGKDTIYFSDLDYCNFKKLNENNSWSIENFITLNEDAGLINNNVIKTKVELGNENISFDITEYVKKIIVENTTDNGLLIKFTDDYLYDKFTYFVKRLGSRHLQNKVLVPVLNIKIDDSLYEVPNNDKKLYFNKDESIYLLNRKSKLESFSKPTLNSTILFNLYNYKNNQKVLDSIAASDSVENYKGSTISGLAKANLNVSQFDEAIEEIIDNEYSDFTLEWFWQDSEFSFINSSLIEINKKYKIKVAGSIDYTLIGAENNNVGTVFVSNSLPSFDIDDPDFVDGEVFVVKETIIHSDKLKIYVPERTIDTGTKNLLSSLKPESSDLGDIEPDSVCKMNVYFIDTKSSLRASKLSSQIKSIDLGDVYYEVYLKSNKEKVVEFDFINNSTKMFYDGEKYCFNFYAPDFLSGKTLLFKFAYYDEFNNDLKYISSINDNTNVISIK